MCKKVVGFAYILFCLCCLSCQDKHGNALGCKENFTKALDIYNSYLLIPENTSDLQNALDALEDSLLCDDTRKMSIEVKISILLILENFQDGERFVDSLDKDDFTRLYKKEMYLYYFRSYLCNDKDCRLDNLRKSEEAITKVIESENIFEEEAFYDLFSIKSLMASEEEFIQQLLLYKTLYPGHEDFFDALSSNFTATAKERRLSE